MLSGEVVLHVTASLSRSLLSIFVKASIYMTLPNFPLIACIYLSGTVWFQRSECSTILLADELLQSCSSRRGVAPTEGCKMPMCRLSKTAPNLDVEKYDFIIEVLGQSSREFFSFDVILNISLMIISYVAVPFAILVLENPLSAAVEWWNSS